MLIRTSVAVAAAFLGFVAVAEATNLDSKNRQVNGFSFHYGPLGQYFGSALPLPGYNTYDEGRSYGDVHRYHRTQRGYPR
jgi:hypothetical protein